MRQYNRVRGRMREEKREAEPFDFRMLKPVFCIVLTENSWSEFYKWPEHYIHRRYMTFDTGIMKEHKGLREDVHVCLDLFRRNPPEINADMPLIDRWLTILSETRTDRFLKLLEIFPAYWELYGEMADFMRKPEELMEMYSDILRILDRNSECIMVTDLQSIVEEKEQEIRENRKQIGLRDEQLWNSQLRLIKQVQK